MKGTHYKAIGDTKLTPIHFCGETWGWTLETEQGFLAEPKETKPTKGEHDSNTCKNCQTTHKELIKRLSEKFNGNDQKRGFPFCCPNHSNLTRVKEFNIASFNSAPELVAAKITFTNQHIINNHKNENYYKNITDYISYTVTSFGQMPNGCGEPLYLSDYFFNVTDLLARNIEINSERKNRLFEFLETYKIPPAKRKNTDLNILLSTYQKWLKIFPFEISFFSDLKPYYKNQLHILNGKPETNEYTGLVTANLHTKSSLIDALLNLTKNLLNKVNIPELRKQGAITDIQANQLEFSEASLNTKTSEITKQYSKGELKYITALKKWLQLHKDYFKEVAPLLKMVAPQQNAEKKLKQKNQFSVLEWTTIFYYADETKLTSGASTVKERINDFMSGNKINTSYDHFKNEYYEAKRRINEKNDYPIKKLELIIPFLKENYNQAVTKVANDIVFLKENKPEY